MYKKKILFVYYDMIVGGSTTSLLSMLAGIDKSRYEVDLLLYRNEGPMLQFLPDGIRVLPTVALYNHRCGRIIKALRFLTKGYMLEAILQNRKTGKKGFAEQVLSEFQAKELSTKTESLYDYAIGFLEGWANRYVAYNVIAIKKYGWLHSEFSAIAKIPNLEFMWMQKMDKIVTVAEKCLNNFRESVPEMAEKAVHYENIMDTELIRKRAKLIDIEDLNYKAFLSSKVFKIITVCRLDIASKGLDRAIKCAARLKADGYQFLWYVVGEGIDRRKLEAMIAETDVSDCFILVGNRLNPYPYVHISDIFCMPSRWEGKPISVTESMMLGVPPVVTEYMSANDQIENGVDGLIACNDEDSIYDAVKCCIDDMQIVLKMKKNLLSREYGNAEYIRTIERELFY